MSRPWLCLAAVLAAFAARPAHAIVFQDSTAQAAGLGAGQSFLDPMAELVITYTDTTQSGCSGSLLAGGLYVLTAAHCVTGDTNTLTAANISLNFANTGLSLTATSYVVDPGWTGVLANGGDLAVIRLATAVTTITGYQLSTGASAVGSVVTMAGYGYTGVGATGYTAGTFGTLRYGQNTYDGVFSGLSSVYSLDFDKVGTSTYNLTGGGAVGSTEAMIAPGDSGGASLLQVGSKWEIVGVHDFIGCNGVNCTPNSSFGQYGGDTSVYASQAWLTSVTVPEPASVALALSGLVGLAGVRRRRNARTR